MQFQATRHDQFACSRSYAAGEMTLHTVSAKTGHTARPRNFPITGRSDRRNVSTSHRRSLRKLQFLHNRLEAWKRGSLRKRSISGGLRKIQPIAWDIIYRRRAVQSLRLPAPPHGESDGCPLQATRGCVASAPTDVRKGLATEDCSPIAYRTP